MNVQSNQEKFDRIEELIIKKVQEKLKKYNPKNNCMPFHLRILGEDKIRQYSFIHSLITMFGISIFEYVAKLLAKSNLDFANVELKQTIGKEISSEAQQTIQNIIDNLTIKKNPDKKKEIEKIRAVCLLGEMKKVKLTNVDLKVTKSNGTIYLFDIKTAKPNLGDFKKFKRTLLEWVAVTLAKDTGADVQTLIAIPYNPYEPKPYDNWTNNGILDCECEIKIAEKFWDFLGGQGTYSELLDCFEQAGKKLKPEMDKRFEQLK